MRNELAYALETLKKKHAMVEKMGPVTDFQAEAREHLRSLELAMELLQRPHFAINPFI
jgi:hypothetical protein